MHLFKNCAILLFGLLTVSALPVAAQRKQPVKKAAAPSDENNYLKNGIKINSKGFKVSEAYLVFDDESLVPENNRVELNQNINMLLIIEEGWTETDGRVFPGSKQVLKLDNGIEILNSEELFAAFDETGVSTEDARYITLNTVITELKNKKNHVVVNFRLWDKKGKAEITGSYKLFIK